MPKTNTRDSILNKLKLSDWQKDVVTKMFELYKPNDQKVLPNSIRSVQKSDVQVAIDNMIIELGELMSCGKQVIKRKKLINKFDADSRLLFSVLPSEAWRQYWKTEIERLLSGRRLVDIESFCGSFNKVLDKIGGKYKS